METIPETNATPAARGWRLRTTAADGTERHCRAGDPAKPGDQTPLCTCTTDETAHCRVVGDWDRDQAEAYYRGVDTEERAVAKARRSWIMRHIGRGLGVPSREAMAITAWRRRKSEAQRIAWEDACADYQSTGGY